MMEVEVWCWEGVHSQAYMIVITHIEGSYLSNRPQGREEGRDIGREGKGVEGHMERGKAGREGQREKTMKR